jgi:hypothetical protein
MAVNSERTSAQALKKPYTEEQESENVFAFLFQPLFKDKTSTDSREKLKANILLKPLSHH